MRKLSYCIATTMLVAQCIACYERPGSTQSPALNAASKSLEGKTQCEPFQWAKGSHGSARDAMIVPVQIDNHDFHFQLDTGADSNFLYGTLADQAGWSSASQTSFQPRSLRVARTIIDRPQIRILRDRPVSKTISGTLGLPDLVGRVSVIDYPGRRFCLFDSADLPPQLRAGFSVKGTLRNGSFFVPIRIGSFTSDSIIFDTGSSALPLLVDLATWRRISGQTEPEKAPTRYEGWAWGKPVAFFGATAQSELNVGAIKLGKPVVFTKKGAPEEFGKSPYRADGIMGNAALWNGIVVLDLSGSVEFRYIQ